MGGGRIQGKVQVPPEGIREAVRRLVAEGYAHLTAITAVDLQDSIELIYHFDGGGGYRHVSVKLPRANPTLPSIAQVVPGADYYEKEVRDLFGVNFQDGAEKRRFILPECYPPDAPPPLLKDVDPASVKALVAEAPTCQVDAVGLHAPLSPESVVVPVGPYHPAFKEPEYFSLVVDGERIVKAFVRIGFVHRGIEKAAESRSFFRDIFLVERICGICSTSHAWCFVEAVERLLNMEVPRRAAYLRTLVAELERIHSHALWLGLVGYWTGFETMFMWVWGLRETIMDLLEEISGNRVHKSFVTIGGVRRDVPDALLRRVSERVETFRREFESLLESLSYSEEIISRTKGIGRYSLDDARKYCAVGPVRRAAGDPFDVRRIEPYGAYPEVEFEVPTSNEGDVYNLIRVRVKEVVESASIIQQLVEKMPSGNPVPPKPFMGTVPEGEAYSRIEAPRGELFYYVKANNTHNPYRVKVRTPTLANIQLAAKILEGQTLSDFPVVVTSIDPCFSCMDRVTIIDLSGKRREVSSKFFESLRGVRR
ncbi:NADH-quinone oxidoreductase subunit D [Thermofilum pendens]|uniref:NADH-ubiquinone oxidoreductase, chain 49kDa n=1 Tax=Thermofilum pendens (strain DSM 2475 / Hrk 5) TaxID=368408 RepID=A1RZ40_THEPD|nr:NADH-quinone oxidoreductase subunit D [Thermofilum pendens]ABL78470.1 NADH-ubiquinone oxidoreductase, chain 49kDa [Thermofilum pendens Hrk 5]